MINCIFKKCHLLHFSLFFLFFGFTFCDDPNYYDTDTFGYINCFQGAPGWFHLGGTCIFPLTQFERNHSTAVLMCGAVNASLGYRETNWLIASQLFDLISNKNLGGLYWTGLKMKTSQMIGVDSDNSTISDFTSIYNPLWAMGEPPETMDDSVLSTFCVALDLRNSSFFGWRAVSCSIQLPILCQTFACLKNDFRCVDNSKCISSKFIDDGYEDCLDGSDERVPTSPTPPSRLQEQKTFEWPMKVSSGGILSPSTMRYGRGECTHKWMVLSPTNRHFVVWVQWLSPITSTTIVIEGKDENGRIYLNSRNSTSSISLSSSSFLLTASNTDTRKVEFNVHYQEINPFLCDLSTSKSISFSSEVIPNPCTYRFTTDSPSSYVALLVNKCEGTTSTVANVIYNNSTVSLGPMSSKKLLILPSSQVEIQVNSTWPGSETQLEMKFFEVKLNGESVDIFMIDRQFQVEWIKKSDEVWMDGQFRRLSINMIVTEDMGDATWRIQQFQKTCSEDNIQLISSNNSQFLPIGSGVFSAFGPTTVIIHQSAEPFQFYSTYSIHDRNSDDDVTIPTTELITTTIPTTTGKPENHTICRLPDVINGYISNVSDFLYIPGTTVYIECSEGYQSIPFVKCSIGGHWYYGSQSFEEPSIRCEPIKCSNETSVELTFNYTADNYNVSYGTVRKYKNWGFANYGPICICGDDRNDLTMWKCYNDHKDQSTKGEGACILPQVIDAQFNVTDSSVFSPGCQIKMMCTLCPSLTKMYTCDNGLWYHNGEVQPYSTFKCDCIEDPDNNPCSHGTYEQMNGTHLCKCENGFKYDMKTDNCVDIDECTEGSHYCDSLSNCVNEEGGFRCECQSGYELYYADVAGKFDAYNEIKVHLIDGFSCVEITCLGTVQKDGNVIAPPEVEGTFGNYITQWWRASDIPTRPYYATKLCSQENCVAPVNCICSTNSSLIPNRNIEAVCPPFDESKYKYEELDKPLIFTETGYLNCANPNATLIGRKSVFCNATLQWEILPECVVESCSDPTDLIQPPLLYTTNNPGSFEIGTILIFKCFEGLVTDGANSTTCYRDPDTKKVYWDTPLPTCVFPPIITTTVPSSSQSPYSTYFPTWTSSWTSSPQQPSPTWSSSSDSSSAGTYFPDVSPTQNEPSESSTIHPSFDFSTWGTSSNPVTGWIVSVPPTSSVSDETSSPPFSSSDDIVIEDSFVSEETNAFEQKENWMMSGDWTWTSSNCILHQWTFPTSFFVTTSPIRVSSEEIEISVDISQCRGSVQVSVSSSSDGFIPSISDFRTVINTTSSGNFVVKLRNVKEYLAISITSEGFSEICGVIVREQKCKEMDYNGIHLSSSGVFSMRRYLPVSCTTNRIPTTVNGYCDSRRGWVIQKTLCQCNPNPPCPTPSPPLQRDQTGCQLNSCTNGKCHHFPNGTYDCTCNYLFVRALDGLTPYCKPDHCARTSFLRNSGYNCETGENDPSITCQERNNLGDFCQFQGKLLNDSYIYFLNVNSPVAVSVFVCQSVDTVYSVDNSNCFPKPTSPPDPTPDDQCSLCGEHTCVISKRPYVGGVYCMCNEGWFGRSCNVTKFCFDSSADYQYRCQNGGTCVLGANPRCECLKEFNGELCENYIGSSICENNVNCVNGWCEEENEQTYCNCYSGWVKDSAGNCTVEWDMCKYNNPCAQNGTCHFDESSGSLSCDCSNSGWKGDYCEQQPKLDDCSVCSSHTDKCFDQFTNYVRCRCSIGYTGANCDVENKNDCDFEPCLNGGTCLEFNFQNNEETIETYNCTCPTGFSGLNCELVILPPPRNCSDFIECHNGGTCGFDLDGNPKCYCTDQYFGPNCDRLCSEVCAHSYGCIDNGTFYCECNSGFTSPYCDVVNDVCTSGVLQCQNGGSCISANQTCSCTDPFTGTFCETNGNLCETNSIVCENGGTCNPRWGNCTCEPEYFGPFCENSKCDEMKCYNGGICIPFNGTCACLPGSTGDNCQDLGQQCSISINGQLTDYCLNGGRCIPDLPTGAACDCSGTEYTGRRCETKNNFNFNLVFNGLPYQPDIVSDRVSNPTIREFTLCSFFQYNHPDSGGSSNLPPYLTLRGYGDSAQQMVFDNNGFHICEKATKCDRTGYPRISITANTWHHFCLVSSPTNTSSPNYSSYLDGLKANVTYTYKFDPGDYAYIQLAPVDKSENMGRFEGMISMTQLYTIRLNEAQIGQLTYDCFNTINDMPPELLNSVILKWDRNFTRVSSNNPGVFVDSSGICKNMKCLYGRQVKSNSNSTSICEKDRISPTVLRCPSTIKVSTRSDFVKVSWKDEDVSFFDNIGVVRIDVNYHNGQQFGIGITAVRYIAYDAEENTAECTFDVIVTQKDCPRINQITVENGTISTIGNGPFANYSLSVKCNDRLFPCDTRPKFYVCDTMGYFKYGRLESGRWYLPPCGVTKPAIQSVNGTVVQNGTCLQVYQKLKDTIWKTANCDVIASCSLTILPSCNGTTNQPVWAQENQQQALQYTFTTLNATTNIAGGLLTNLKQEFQLVRQDGTVKCDNDHPVIDEKENVTTCVSCPEGSFADSSLRECVDCPVDMYRNSSSSFQLKCTECPDGTTTGTITGAVDISQCYKKCPIGSFEENGDCYACPIGTYGDSEGLQKCPCCAFDRSTFNVGSKSLEDCKVTCQPGSAMYRDENDPTPRCVECSIGYYKEGENGSCIKCPIGLTTSSNNSTSINDCNELDCSQPNTKRNLKVIPSPNITYNELCVPCEAGYFQNLTNQDSCRPCSELESTEDVPVTCQSSCNPDSPTPGCTCQRSYIGGVVATATCALVEPVPVKPSLNPLKVVLPLVFGVLLLCILVAAFCFRKQIVAWFRKSQTSDDQHVAPSHWERHSSDTLVMSSPTVVRRSIPPPTSIIPRPNLRIVTSREELDQLPPLPSSSTPSFHVDSGVFGVERNGLGGLTVSSGMRHLGTESTGGLISGANGVRFEANGSPKLIRSPVIESDDSSLDSFF